MPLDEAELTHTETRSESEELRCVLAVIRHGGVCVRGMRPARAGCLWAAGLQGGRPAGVCVCGGGGAAMHQGW